MERCHPGDLTKPADAHGQQCSNTIQQLEDKMEKFWHYRRSVLQGTKYNAKEDWESIRLERCENRLRFDSAYSSQEAFYPWETPIQLRKLSLLVNMTAELRKRLERRLEKYIHHFQIQPHDNAEGTCLIYTPEGSNPRSQKHAYMGITWRDHASTGSDMPLSLTMQVGTLYMVLNGTLTKEQQFGWVHGKWEMSHLCGNAACVNPFHHTMEARYINVERKSCHNIFNSHYPCEHSPKCLLRDKEGNIMPARDEEQEKLLQSKAETRFIASGSSIYLGMLEALQSESRDKGASGKRRASESGSCFEIDSRPLKRSKHNYGV